MYEQTMNNDVTLTGGENPLLAGRYQVVSQLGIGGMGSVWLAEDTQLDNKPFAVKMLPSILVSNKRAYRQLKDEAIVAMKLVHPNIVQIRAFEENNGNPFLVMDYIEGQTLDDYLAEKGKLTEDETVRILKPIAGALDYAHGEGVVHRDVKPANVMIRKDGHPYILDFGIAREIQETMTRVTGKLSSGTLLYMSPEQLRGQPPKAAQDVYSFAAMAYECLKGEPPFSRGQIEYQILNEQPERLPNDIRMSAAIMRGLSKEPEHRPNLCVEVLLDFSAKRPPIHVGEQAYTTPTRLTPPTVAKPQAPQKSNVAGTLIPIVCIIVALVTLGGVMWHRNVQRQEEARRRAVAAQQEEAARRQREAEERQAKEVALKKAQEEQLAKEKREEEDRKAKAEAWRLEEEKRSLERELARQKEEETRAAEAERAAKAVRENVKSDNAKALQEARDALDLVSKAPKQYGGSVATKLTQDQQDLLTPLYLEMMEKESEYAQSLYMFTENHPDVKMKKNGRDMATAKFISVVSILQDGLSTTSSAQDSQKAIHVLYKEPLRYETVAMLLSIEQRKLLSPVFQELVLIEAELKRLRKVYTDVNPKVVGTRQLEQEILTKFKALVKQCLDNKQVTYDEYIVKDGDTFAGIAYAHGTTVKSLKALNGLVDFRIRVGQRLKVPKQGDAKRIKWNKSLLNVRGASSIGAGTRGGSSYGDASTESMVMGTLWWLYGRQNPDGSWGKDEDKYRIGSITALALLTFLAHGEGYEPGKASQNDFAKAVNSGVRYLASSIRSDSAYNNALVQGDDRMKSSFLLVSYALCEAYGMTGDKKCGEIAYSCLEKIIVSISKDRKIACENQIQTFSLTRLAYMVLCMGDFVGLHPENISDCKKTLEKWIGRVFNADPRGITKQEFLMSLSCFSIFNRLDPMWLPESIRLNPYVAEPKNQDTEINFNVTTYLYYAGMKSDATHSDVQLWQTWNTKMKKFYADASIVLGEKIMDAKGKAHAQRYWDRNKISPDDYVFAETCMTALQLMVYYRYPTSLLLDTEGE